MWRIVLALLVFVMLTAAPTAVLRCQLSGTFPGSAVDPCSESIQQLNTHLTQSGLSAVLLPLSLVLSLWLLIFSQSLPPLISPGEILLTILIPPPRLV